MSEKFTKADLDVAVSKLGMMRYFPSDPTQKAFITALLAKMVPHKDALEWLVDQCVNRITDWPGPAELRELLCWKYSPADGVPSRGWCTIPGFTPSDGEAKYIQRNSERETHELAPSSREMLRLLASKKGFPQ